LNYYRQNKVHLADDDQGKISPIKKIMSLTHKDSLENDSVKIEPSELPLGI
jgi:hypothetical protein